MTTSSRSFSVDSNSPNSTNNLTEVTQVSSSSSDSTDKDPPPHPLIASLSTRKTPTATNGRKLASTAPRRSHQQPQGKKKRSRRGKTKQRKDEDDDDDIGASLANLLNENPEFDYNRFREQQVDRERAQAGRKRSRNELSSNTSSPNDKSTEYEFDWDSPPSFRPLLGSQNRYRVRVLVKCAWILLCRFRPWRDIPEGWHTLKEYLFRPPPDLFERKTESLGVQALRFLLLVASLIVFGCVVFATVVALVVSYVYNFARVVWFFVGSLLVDWNEIAGLFPWWCHTVVGKVFGALLQIDRIILFGNRWRGREWNKDGFDFTDSLLRNPKNPPESSVRDQYLWTLPPPNALIRSSEMIPKRAGTPRRAIVEANAQSLNVSRSGEAPDAIPKGQQWWEYTTHHVEAIDYCYIMLREEFIERQYTRLKRRRSCIEEILNDGNEEKQSSMRRASSVSSLDNFRQEFVLDPSTQNIAPEEIDEVTGISLRLKEILEADDSFDDSDSNDAAENQSNRALMSSYGIQTKESFSNNDGNGSIGSGSDGTTTDMNWMDVGTEIGMKLLGSSAVQKAMASHDTVEKITELKEKMDHHFNKKDVRDNSNKSTDGSDRLSPLPTTPQRWRTAATNSGDYFGENVGASNSDASGYNLDPYAEAPPIHPMWTSAAAAAVSPTHSFATIETMGTKDDSTLGSPATWGTPDGDGRQSWLLSSPADENNAKDPSDIFMPKVDVIPNNTELGSPKKKFKASKIVKPVAVLTKKLRRRKRKNKPLKEPAIELVCSSDNDDINHIVKQISPASNLRGNIFLLPGVKIAVPLLPINPDGPKQHSSSRKRRKERFQMGTVVSSKRICVYERNNMPQSGPRGTNCLSITVNLDKCFLRNGQFATMSIRIMDRWGPRYMPKHSKLPMGSCVATSFGLGVLVGWRVEDDCHIVRSLWQHRGSGSAYAYLRRDSIHATMEAAVGFDVNTTHGKGTVVGYVNGGPQFKSGRYFVSIADEGRFCKEVTLNRTDILSCESAKFIPIVEHIRAAAQYQLQIDRYKELHDAQSNHDESANKLWGDFSKYSDILWKSFLKAIDEDEEFDDGMNEFMQNCVNFLNQLDASDSVESPVSQKINAYDIENFDASLVIHATDSSKSSLNKSTGSVSTGAGSEKPDSGFWLMNNMFDLFNNKTSAKKDENDYSEENPASEEIEIQCTPRHRSRSDKNYARAYAILRTLTRTVTMAKAASVDEPSFKIAMNVCHEFLVFFKTVIQVSQKNMNHDSLEVWRSSWTEIVSVFGPVQQRLQKIGEGIAERMEKHGRRAKARLLRFVDFLVQDDALFLALEQGDWTRCAEQFESALVQSKIIDEKSREHYRKTALFLYNHFSAATSQDNGAAARNNEKLEQFLMVVQLFAAPRKSLLELFLQDSTLEILERIFVRAFSKDEVAQRMLNIHCSNFQELRRFRMLKDFTIAGKLWIPLLDAADEEFCWAVSKLPPNAQEYLSPISSLFSLCVVQFHKMDEGDLTKDWLNFLMEEEAANIIHDLDMKLILALESFSRDVKDTMVVLPYYPSIDVDILNLVDEVNIDEFVKEASVALEDESRLRRFIKEKATIMVERFLDYLPKMSIPVEKRDLGNGWVLTCRGAGGGDLTLTELVIKRENLTCQVMGGDSLLFPAAATLEDQPNNGTIVEGDLVSVSMPNSPIKIIEETSILTVIKEIIVNAQRDGCWVVGEGGINHPPTDKYAASVLGNIPVSSVLNCGIELWRNLEIDDDELLEIAIRDVTYQIELNEGRKNQGNSRVAQNFEDTPMQPRLLDIESWQLSNVSSGDSPKPRRFNPRVDPTVLFLEIKKLTFNLENFLFRIEKEVSKKTIFDPHFDGTGSILVKNVLVKLRVECFKGYVVQNHHRSKPKPEQPSGRSKKRHNTAAVPVLQLTDLDVSLEQVGLTVQDTGADWLLNKVVDGFGDKFAEIISGNLREQVRAQMEEFLVNINGYFEENPDVLLGVLDISLDDLDEMDVLV